MGQKYSSNSASGYNSTPPPDDGTVSEANKGKWSTIKTKLSDPVKDLADAINTDLVEHFDNGPVAYTTSQAIGASHNGKIIQVSGVANTQTLADATTLGAGWNCEFVSTDATNTVTVARATAHDMINETTANVSILPLQSFKFTVNAAANGFLAEQKIRQGKTNILTEIQEIYSVNPTLLLTETDASTDNKKWRFQVNGETLYLTITNDVDSINTNALTIVRTDTTIDAIILGATAISTSGTFSSGGNLSEGANRVYTVANRTHNDVQTFLNSGTWTKPSGFPSTALAIIECWGGGGGGGNVGPGGGGGAAYKRREILLSSLGTSETVTIGNGGAISNNGQNTTFGSFVTAYGGGGADNSSGAIGGGGGIYGLGNFSNVLGGNVAGIVDYLWNGGDGCANAVDATYVNFGIYGAGGGAGDTTHTAGTSVSGGHGGYWTAGPTSVPPTVPGGGGAPSQAGAKGMCRVTVL